MARSKQTISLESLKELGKVHLKEPNATHYLSDDIAVVVSTHHAFLMAVAPKTKRLNPVSLALVGKDVFQMSNREAQQFGSSLAHAYSHCLNAGQKATTGEKLTKEILSVCNAAVPPGDCKKEQTPSSSKVKAESSSSCKAKAERSLSPPPAAKALKTCLSSPSQIALLYGASSSSNGVKVMHLCM